MAGDNAILFFSVVGLFMALGLVTPFVALEFGGTIATFEVTSLSQAGILGIFNAVASMLFWTFGFPVWINIVLFIPIKAMTWYMILK